LPPDSINIIASKYELYLPSAEQLLQEIKQIEMQTKKG
jgi:hypothetical protein